MGRVGLHLRVHSGKAAFVKRLEYALSLWRHPDGAEVIRAEVRRAPGSKPAKYHGSFYIDDYGSHRKALNAARSAVTREVEARERGEAPEPPRKIMRLEPFVRTVYERWALSGKLAASTYYGSYRRFILTFLIPLLGEYSLPAITFAVIEETRVLLALPRCAICEAKQHKEDLRHRRAPMATRGYKRRYGNCGHLLCGYGLSRTSVATFVVVLGSVLKVARLTGYIDKHPLAGEPGFKWPRVGKRRKVTPRAPHLIERARALCSAQGACAISLVFYCRLRPQEAVALYFRDALDEEGAPREVLSVSKAIKLREGGAEAGDRLPRFHVVEGVRVPRALVDKLKNEDDSTPSSKIAREVPLPRQVGTEIHDLWVARGRPPLDSVIFVTVRGPYRGSATTDPSGWGTTHVKPGFERAGFAWNPRDSFNSLRHLGIRLAQIGPGWTTQETAVVSGNTPETISKFYDGTIDDADRYRGKTLEQCIDIARALAAAPDEPLHDESPTGQLNEAAG